MGLSVWVLVMYKDSVRGPEVLGNIKVKSREGEILYVADDELVVVVFCPFRAIQSSVPTKSPKPVIPALSTDERNVVEVLILKTSYRHCPLPAYPDNVHPGIEV